MLSAQRISSVEWLCAADGRAYDEWNRSSVRFMIVRVVADGGDW